jgi:hypothetical protein
MGCRVSEGCTEWGVRTVDAGIWAAHAGTWAVVACRAWVARQEKEALAGMTDREAAYRLAQGLPGRYVGGDDTGLEALMTSMRL